MSVRNGNEKRIGCLSVRLFLAAAVPLLFISPIGMAGEDELVNDKFEGDRINEAVWTVEAPKDPAYGEAKVVDGKVHLAGRRGEIAKMTLKRAVGGDDAYVLEFDLYPVAKENSGYGICMTHLRPEGYSYWWLDFGATGNLGVFAYADAQWLPRAGAANCPLDQWYHVKVTNEPGKTALEVTDRDTGKLRLAVNVPHDGGGPGNLSFQANSKSAGACKGVYLDNVTLRLKPALAFSSTPRKTVDKMGMPERGRPGVETVTCGVGAWPEERGNHRALIQVSERAEAVRVHLPWRRRDVDPEKKNIQIFDATTGKQIMNVVRAEVKREFGEVIFQPATAPRIYEVYYLPYVSRVGTTRSEGEGPYASDELGAYTAPRETADPGWLKATGLEAKLLPAGKWKTLPQAKVLEFQARSEFDRFDPMEVVATAKETAELLAKYPDRAYLLFPEDRKYPVRMEDDLPLRWIQNGPSLEFSGQAQPGEFYVFQIGVDAARRPIPNLTLTYGDLQSGKGESIPAAAFRCFNLGGTDWLGRPFKKTFLVEKGKIRPLWVGVQVPPRASGNYQGTIRVQPEGLPEVAVKLRLNVSGPVLADAGDRDLWRLSRLRWLDSTLGIDDDVTPPYTALKAQGRAVSGLGRTVRFGQGGLPESIESNGREILSRPMGLTIDTSAGPVVWKPDTNRLLEAKPGFVVRESTATGGPFTLTTWSKMEFDGCINFRVVLSAKEAAGVNDIALEIPIKKEIATYLMGFGKQGGYRPKTWNWVWSQRADHMAWIGDADAGLQCKLLGPEDIWEYSVGKAGPPKSWNNHGLGGCAITEVGGDTVLERIFTGKRTLKAGEELQFRFRLLVTPFKPIDKNHWNWRHGLWGDINGDDANILHIHHASFENPYLNYPFLTTDRLAATVKAVKAIPAKPTGSLTYPAEGNINLDRGALHIWTRTGFDPQAELPEEIPCPYNYAMGRFTPDKARYNQSLFTLEFPTGEGIVFFWNRDRRGMSAYIKNNTPDYPAIGGRSSPQWQPGEKHLLSLSWGERLAIFIDGKMLASTPCQGTLKNALKDAVLRFSSGGFGIDAVKITDIPFQAGMPITASVDNHTLLLDTFSDWDGKEKTRPEKITGQEGGKIEGTCEASPGTQGQEIVFASKNTPMASKGVNLYYGIYALATRAPELWPLRSLGYEVFEPGAGGGNPWLKEHLVSGYTPGWLQPVGNGETDATIVMTGLSRWDNYYVEGMRWLMEQTGIDGLYLDGIGQDRETTKRLAKVMRRINPDSRMVFHSGEWYHLGDLRMSPANGWMEHFPYLNTLWFGELFDYNKSPDYWLVEISGIPFGLTGEMFEGGGNQWRGMIYGMTSQKNPSVTHMWKFWDEFGIQDAEMIGYWNSSCPVKTGRNDVLATVYKKKDKTLIAIASWASEPVRCRLTIDWKALGLDARTARLTAPALAHFQDAAQFSPDAEIPVAPGKGWLLILEKKRP